MVNRNALLRYVRKLRRGLALWRRPDTIRHGVCFWITLSVCIGPILAQSAANQFEHLSVKNGLSHNSVNCILQDREGFLWFGTNDGLNRYDGYTFTVFQPDPTNPGRSFQHNVINGLCEDRANRLWAVTEGGLHEINKQTGRVIPHLIRADNANRWNSQLSVYQDHQGYLWVSSYAGVARYDPNRHHFKLYPSPRRETPFKSVYEDSQHRLWVATFRGLYQLDQQTGLFKLVPAPTMVSGHDQPVFNSFYDDGQGTLWLATAGDGLFQLDLRSQPLRLMPYNPGGQINRYLFMNSLHRDALGYLWVGTTEGLQRIDTHKQQVTTYHPDPDILDGLSSDNAQTACHDRNGTLWVGTPNGIDRRTAGNKPFVTYQPIPHQGNTHLLENKVNALLVDEKNQFWLSNQYYVYRTDPQQRRVTQIPTSQLGFRGNHTNHTFTIRPNGPSGLWLATWDGLYAYDQATNRYLGYPSEVPTQFLSRGRDGLLWLGGEGGIASFNPNTHQYTYYKYDPAEKAGLPDKFIYGLLASRTGDVWVSVNGKGVSRFNPATKQFTHYTAGHRPGQLTDNTIQTFYEDKAGIIWVGTHQGGLNRYDPRTDQFSATTTRNGLPSNHIAGIIGDRSGYLWLSTNKGICRFDPATKRIRNYTESDGLPSNDFLTNAVYARHNRLYFGSMNGIVYFNPDSIRDDRHPFPVRITNISVMDKNWPLTDSVITLPYDKNFLSFEFAALTYRLAQENQYAYQLVGVDETWVKSGNRRFANYTGLEPGNYSFRVKAMNGDGIWSRRGTSITLVIRPPWWRTWWAYGLYVLAFLALLRAYIAYRSRLLLRKNRILEEKVVQRTNKVQEQKEEIRAQRDHLEQTLSNLQATQTQLIQKEKLASLGELTAGIAHEIQNPLNFVNNYSELSAELVDELKDELQAGRSDDALAIANNLATNLHKINHHGSRASSIVKGMLEHTRTDDGERYPVDVNALVDEYLRLAYHGQRARNPLFNCTLVQELQPDLGKRNLMGQDLSRVLLNLFTNAFYAVYQRQQHAPADYEPTLTVRTQAVDQAVEILVSDNGTGIPAAVRQKIFQPFFTTKPTGEGTGLGLSLSYDIITKGHGGSLTVHSREGEGSTFIIQLPNGY